MLKKDIPIGVIEFQSSLRSGEFYREVAAIEAPVHLDDNQGQHCERKVSTESPKVTERTGREAAHSRKYGKATSNVRKIAQAVLAFLRIWLSLPLPFFTQGKLFEKAGITGGSKQAQIKRFALSHGLIKEYKLQIGGTYSCILEPLDKAYELVGIEKPQFPSKGGYLHQFIAHHVAAWANAHGYRTDIEYLLPNYKAVDVALRKDKDLILVEIVISPPLEKELVNIEKDFASGLDFSRLLMVVKDSKTRNQLQLLINSAKELASFRNKIAVVLAGNFLTNQGDLLL